jgi:hypothetical protein
MPPAATVHPEKFTPAGTQFDPKLVRKAEAPQLKWPKVEVQRLANRVVFDANNAMADHDLRMTRFQKYYMRWRNRTEDIQVEGRYRVPITQWQVYSKWAKEMGSLFGDDAEITAKPVGPNDQRLTRKISRFMTWLIFDSMKIANKAGIFDFRKILFGRSHAYTPWIRETYQVPSADGTEQEVVHYEGPGFFPLWPDDLLVPAEDVDSLQEFSFLIRKYPATPDELLRGEDKGIYQGIAANFDLIVNYASNRRQRDFTADKVKQEKDWAEGVTYEGNLSGANTITVHEWYGKWRKLKGRKDASETNLTGRELYESDIVIRYIPDLHLVIGIQDLAEMYPTMKDRRPFSETALVKDGSYWGPSFGELLEAIEAELSSNHQLASQAGALSVGPVIFYTPASGFDPDTFSYEPGTAVATDNPGAIKVVNFQADLHYPIMKEQTMIAYAERVTGISDQTLGRSSDRPNAPRTATQSLALSGEGDVRASLDLSVLREDWGEILTRFWQLIGMYAAPSLFFRVTEEDADGLFPTQQGGALLNDEDRTGRYDFDLKFATNAFSREQQKQNQLSLYQLDLQNPLIQQNPRALWLVLDKIHKAFGDDRFCDAIPEPPDLGLPMKPIEEWTRCLQGEQIQVNPMDNDQLHIMDHNKRLSDAAKDPNHNDNAYHEMSMHVVEHIQQLNQKRLMAELTSRLAESMKQNMITQQGGLTESHAPVAMQDMHARLGSMLQPAPDLKPKKQGQ